MSIKKEEIGFWLKDHLSKPIKRWIMQFHFPSTLVIGRQAQGAEPAQKAWHAARSTNTASCEIMHNGSCWINQRKLLQKPGKLAAGCCLGTLAMNITISWKGWELTSLEEVYKSIDSLAVSEGGSLLTVTWLQAATARHQPPRHMVLGGV